MIAYDYLWTEKRRVARQTTESFRRETCAINERLVRHLFRTCGRPSCRTLGVSERPPGSPLGTTRVTWKFRNDGTLPVQPCASTRVAVTSESLLDGARENYTSSSSQPPRNRIVTTPPELPVSDPRTRTSKLYFRSLWRRYLGSTSFLLIIMIINNFSIHRTLEIIFYDQIASALKR